MDEVGLTGIKKISWVSWWIGGLSYSVRGSFPCVGLRSRRVRCCLLLFVATLLLTAQSDAIAKGTVIGVIRSPEVGGRVWVELLDAKSHEALAANNFDLGRSDFLEYSLSDVRPGWYYLTAISDCCYAVQVPPFEVRAGSVPINITLVRAGWWQTFGYGLNQSFKEDATKVGGAILVAVSILLGLFREQIISRLRNPEMDLVVECKVPYVHAGFFEYGELDPDYLPAKPEELVLKKTDKSVLVSWKECGTLRGKTICVYFYRLWIRNQSRRRLGFSSLSTSDVEIILNRIWEDERLVQQPVGFELGDGTQRIRPEPEARMFKDIRMQPRQNFLPRNLRWANTWDLGKACKSLHSPELLLKHRISPDSGRFCDLGFVVDPLEQGHAENSNDPVLLHLALETLNESEESIIRAIHGYRILEILIDSDNQKTPSKLLVCCLIEDRWKKDNDKCRTPHIELSVVTDKHFPVAIPARSPLRAHPGTQP